MVSSRAERSRNHPGAQIAGTFATNSREICTAKGTTIKAQAVHESIHQRPGRARQKYPESSIQGDINKRLKMIGNGKPDHRLAIARGPSAQKATSKVPGSQRQARAGTRRRTCDPVEAPALRPSLNRHTRSHRSAWNIASITAQRPASPARDAARSRPGIAEPVDQALRQTACTPGSASWASPLLQRRGPAEQAALVQSARSGGICPASFHPRSVSALIESTGSLAPRSGASFVTCQPKAGGPHRSSVQGDQQGRPAAAVFQGDAAAKLRYSPAALNHQRMAGSGGSSSQEALHTLAS